MRHQVLVQSARATWRSALGLFLGLDGTISRAQVDEHRRKTPPINRGVAKYMRPRHNRGPSPGWRDFLKRHESNIWVFCNGPVVVKPWTRRGNVEKEGAALLALSL
jgi:hypothetical protein